MGFFPTGANDVTIRWGSGSYEGYTGNVRLGGAYAYSKSANTTSTTTETLWVNEIWEMDLNPPLSGNTNATTTTSTSSRSQVPSPSAVDSTPRSLAET